MKKGTPQRSRRTGVKVCLRRRHAVVSLPRRRRAKHRPWVPLHGGAAEAGALMAAWWQYGERWLCWPVAFPSTAVGGAVANPDLAREAADLLSITDKSRSRSLGDLAALAARQVPACSGATATLWQDGEPQTMAATHPDISNLTEVELASQRGPETSALATGETAHCPDTLAEERWPEYAQAALARGVRCSVTLAHRPG